MSDDDKNPRPPVPLVVDGSQDAALIAIHEQNARRQHAAIHSGTDAPVWVPPPRPVMVHDGSSDVAILAAQENHRQQSFIAGTFSTAFVPPPEEFGVLLSRAVITPYEQTAQGRLIWAITVPLRSIIERIMNEPSLMFEIDPRKWEEIIAATYDESGLFDEVTLTPRSGDLGRDLIAVKKGFGSVRLIESVKRYKPGKKTTAEEVQALLGVLNSDPQATKGVVSTTSEFAPKIWKNPQITQYIPYRLELVNGANLLKRLAEYTTPKRG